MPARRVNIRRDCQHTRTHHEHGTVLAYRKDRCRCDLCYKAKSEDIGYVRRLQAYGRYKPRPLAGPSLIHLRRLADRGVGYRLAAKLCGVSDATLYSIARGDRTRVSPATEAAILAIPLDTPSPAAMVDPTGSRRRMQALSCLGWPALWLAREAGISRSCMAGVMQERTQLVHRGTARKISELYDKYWDKSPCPVSPAERTIVTRTVLRARSLGWVPPMAWDDDEIDDPSVRKPRRRDVVRR